MGGDTPNRGSDVGVLHRACVHEGRESNFLAFGETIGVPGRITRLKGRRVSRVLGVEMEFTEEGLSGRYVVCASVALLGTLEGQVLALSPYQAGQQQE